MFLIIIIIYKLYFHLKSQLCFEKKKEPLLLLKRKRNESRVDKP